MIEYYVAGSGRKDNQVIPVERGGKQDVVLEVQKPKPGPGGGGKEFGHDAADGEQAGAAERTAKEIAASGHKGTP